MSSWVIADLRNERPWDIDRLVLKAFAWRSSSPLRRLDEITLELPAIESAEPGYPVITPRGIDNVTGVLRRRERKYVGSAFRVGGFGRALRQGDLLVPPSDTPVLLVNEDMLGSMASSQFIALRPDAVDAYWLWGALNSRSGRTLRRLVTSGASGMIDVKAALRCMEIPIPTIGEQRDAAQRLAGIERGLRGQEVEAPTTWWKISDLRGHRWRFALASANPSLLQDGEPLSKYCDVLRGRSYRQREGDSTLDSAYLLPIATGTFLAGRGNELARVAPESIIAQPGDVLVAVIGDRPLAQVVREPMAVSSSVYLLRPHPLHLGPAIATFLNSPVGLARWRFLSLDGIAPFMRMSDLREFPVPAGSLYARGDRAIPPGPLDLQLESILWPS